MDEVQALGFRVLIWSNTAGPVEVDGVDAVDSHDDDDDDDLHMRNNEERAVAHEVADAVDDGAEADVTSPQHAQHSLQQLDLHLCAGKTVRIHGITVTQAIEVHQPRPSVHGQTSGLQRTYFIYLNISLY